MRHRENGRSTRKPAKASYNKNGIRITSPRPPKEVQNRREKAEMYNQ